MITLKHPILENVTATLDSKPYWTSHAFIGRGDQVCVARVDAVGSNGKLYMIDLTQEQIDSIKADDSYADLSDPDFCESIDSKRPASNNPDKRVSGISEQKNVMNKLQAEA